MKKPPDPPLPPSQQPFRRSRSIPRSSLLCSAKPLHSLPSPFNSNLICLQCYASCKSLPLIVTIGSSPMFQLKFSIQICVFSTGYACSFSLRVTSIDGTRKPFESSQALCGAVQSNVPWPFKIQHLFDAIPDFTWHNGLSYCNANFTAIWAQGREPLIWIAKINSHHNSLHSNPGVLVPLSFLVMPNSMIIYASDCCWVLISAWALLILDGIVTDLGGFKFTHRSLILLDLAFCVLELVGLGGFYSLFVNFMNCSLMFLGVMSMLGWQGVNSSIFRWVLPGCSFGSLLGYRGRWDTIKWMSHANYGDLSCTDSQFALVRRLNEYVVLHLSYCLLLLPSGLFDLGVATSHWKWIHLLTEQPN